MSFSSEKDKGLQPSPETTRKEPSPTASQLFEELKAMDSKLFDVVFQKCDLETLKTLVTDDFEFYHDRGGLVATNGAQFVENVRKTCEGQSEGKQHRSRRELIPGSLEVYPLNNYGAIQTGIHRFYVLESGKPERASDIAKFTHVWKTENGRWQIARVLSYDHRPANP